MPWPIAPLDILHHVSTLEDQQIPPYEGYPLSCWATKTMMYIDTEKAPCFLGSESRWVLERVEGLYVTSVERVIEYKIDKEGARGVKVKYLLHKGVGAKRLQLRLFTVDVGGYTLLEQHAHEHEVFMLQGRALVRGGDRETIIRPGNVIFIPSFEEHKFVNIGEEPVKFLCTKETP